MQPILRSRGTDGHSWERSTSTRLSRCGWHLKGAFHNGRFQKKKSSESNDTKLRPCFAAPFPSHIRSSANDHPHAKSAPLPDQRGTSFEKALQCQKLNVEREVGIASELVNLAVVKYVQVWVSGLAPYGPRAGSNDNDEYPFNLLFHFQQPPSWLMNFSIFV